MTWLQCVEARRKRSGGAVGGAGEGSGTSASAAEAAGAGAEGVGAVATDSSTSSSRFFKNTSKLGFCILAVAVIVAPAV